MPAAFRAAHRATMTAAAPRARLRLHLSHGAAACVQVASLAANWCPNTNRPLHHATLCSMAWHGNKEGVG